MICRSNGLVERHIQTVKNTLLKMFAEGKTLWESLAAIRSTRISATLRAPSVLLQGRNLRGNLPFLPSELKPKLVPASVVTTELSARQARATFNQARQFSSRSSALLVGQLVWTYVNNKWIHGAVHSVCPEPQSYIIRLDYGLFFRRTRWAINVDGGVSSASSSVSTPLPVPQQVLSSVPPVRCVSLPHIPVMAPTVIVQQQVVPPGSSATFSPVESAPRAVAESGRHYASVVTKSIQSTVSIRAVSIDGVGAFWYNAKFGVSFGSAAQ